MITENKTVIKIITNSLDGNGVLSVVSAEEILKIQFNVHSPTDGQTKSFCFEGNGKHLESAFYVGEPVLWSTDTPNLYNFEITVFYEQGSECVSGKFGIRTISVDKNRYICLNGRPVFIKGYIRGATAHDHANLEGLAPEEFYRKNIREAKRFGFNLVRFHSVVPDEAFLKAADEEGLLVHVELRPPNDIYDNLSEMVTSGNVIVEDSYILKVMNAYYEHPSLAVYCIGNEIKRAPAERVEHIGKLIRESDPSRLYIDTCAWGRINRPNITADVQHMGYYFPFGKHISMFDETESLSVDCAQEGVLSKVSGEDYEIARTFSVNVPLIAHEVCHYTALRDFFKLREKFLKYGAALPWWIDEEIKMIRAKKMEKAFPEMYEASKFFQFECWKNAFERIRESSLLAGFHFLQFADTDVYENSNGVVDCFDSETYVTARQFLAFNGDRVIIARLGSRLYTEGEQLNVPVMLSDFGQSEASEADCFFSLKDSSGKICTEGCLPRIDVRRKGVRRICTIRINLPAVSRDERMTLRIWLKNSGAIYADNEWKIWVYRQRKPITYADFLAYEQGEVAVTDSIKRALELLAEGKRVCLIYRSDWTRHVAHKQMRSPEYAFEATWNRFKPVIWDRGTNYGGLCEEKILNKYGFVTDRYYDFNYSVITEDCDKIVLDNFPIPVKSLLTGIDKSVRDRFDAGKDYFNEKELMYDRTLRNFSYMFELRAGKGKLLVCGLNLTGLDKNEPSSAAAADFILRYLYSEDFCPADEIALNVLEKYLKDCAKRPVKERMMTQFWQLDEAPVESKEYWKESQRYLLEKEE